MNETNTKNDVLLKILQEKRLIPNETLEQIIPSNPGSPPFSDEILCAAGLMSRVDMMRILENYFFCPAIDPRELQMTAAAVLLVPKRMAIHYEVLPVQLKGETLVLACAAPDNVQAIKEIKSLVRRNLDLRVCPQTALHEVIENWYESDRGYQAHPPTQPKKPAMESGMIREKTKVEVLLPELAHIPAGEGAATTIANELLKRAVEARATDIHIEPGREELTIRLRIDGVMIPAARLTSEIAPSLISRFKIIGGMDIAERRVPQDGRYNFELDNMFIDCRISSLPSRWGEKVVIRLLTKNMNLLDIEQLQMPKPMLDKWKEFLQLPLGMILVTGPTGSGKTTTLYATIASLDREGTNIITIEDPIEYEMPGITQVQINTKAGLTFSTALRSILRQDPDTVLVGEIRDTETVEIACRAALTGHKMFSTLHTNDAPSAITRLLDMGVPPYLLTAALKAILAQRLVRVLCPDCKDCYKPSELELARLGYPKIQHLYKARGCSKCGNTGYTGRMAVFELLVIDESMHRLIMDRSSLYTLRHHAMEKGMTTLGEITRSLVISGKTSLAEGERVVFSEEAREQQCPSCQAVIRIDFSVCPYCNHVLKEACPSCGQAVSHDWQVCPNCGSELDLESRKIVCSNCLAALQPEWDSCPYCGETH